MPMIMPCPGLHQAVLKQTSHSANLVNVYMVLFQSFLCRRAFVVSFRSKLSTAEVNCAYSLAMTQ